MTSEFFIVACFLNVREEGNKDLHGDHLDEKLWYLYIYMSEI